MTNQHFDIYMIGVGGQGIGLLSETLIRAAERAGHQVRGVDTHGLAQRGGTVTSCLRLGEGAHSPMIREGAADLVLALERHEALRGAATFLRRAGTLLYFDALWQPLNVRLGAQPQTTTAEVEAVCGQLGARHLRIFDPNLPDPRMQNVSLLRTLLQESLVPGLKLQHLEGALGELLTGKVLEANLALLNA
jgi:indolepyruvate ferredoxin oxidoreductase beta subunit